MRVSWRRPTGFRQRWEGWLRQPEGPSAQRAPHVATRSRQQSGREREAAKKNKGNPPE